MFSASRRVILYWTLLLLPTFAVGAGAILLLQREQVRLGAQTAEADASRRAAVAARARLVAESVELIVSESQTGLLDTLAGVPAAELSGFLDSWERSNPLVGTAFRSTSLGRLIRPAPGPSTTPERALFIERFGRLFTESPPWGAGVKEEQDRVEKQQNVLAPERQSVASNVGQVQSARRDANELSRQQAVPLSAGRPLADAAGSGAAAGPRERDEALGPVAKAVEAKAAAPDRRGWIAPVIDRQLHLLGWVQPAASGEIRGVELNLAALARLFEGALPADFPAGEGYALVDREGKVLHGVGNVSKVLLQGSSVAHIPLSVTMLPGWEAVGYWQPGIVSSGSSFFVTGSILVAIFVLVIAASGFVLLRQSQRSDAEAALKTSFVANVSHEFKTPLTTIRLYSELLEQGRVRDRAQERDYLRTIGSETQRLARLVGNVLDFSRLEQGRKKYERQQIDLVPELARLLATQEPRLTEAGITLKTDLPTTALRLMDRDAIEQIVLNLIDNAVKYGAAGGELLVSLTVGSDGRTVVKVADRGPGVPDDHRERIFDKFHRVDESLTSGRSGAGLGLSIARQLARGLGGDLRCEPREGGGAAFILELP